ncbi:hypothetical protein E2C01_101130 [Portunus trituberculatus]|uniref:Uncharacterized protein n=1 Tax=Portunus trituberculatus TaxID=210409 RepID=A0A5B7KDY9_PORTR|nr:hypothetical protein [Portunus trituberculatus]
MKFRSEGQVHVLTPALLRPHSAHPRP